MQGQHAVPKIPPRRSLEAAPSMSMWLALGGTGHGALLSARGVLVTTESLDHEKARGSPEVGRSQAPDTAARRHVGHFSFLLLQVCTQNLSSVNMKTAKIHIY